ncbi:MAG: Phosphatidylglycerophosphatase and protein-tyrosine phosphatase 1, partial [Paramarteilia canceri]
LGFNHLIVEVQDFIGVPCILQYKEAIEFIEKNISSNSESKVYIHCKAGRSRSASICAAFIIYKNFKNQKNDLLVNDAIKLIKDKRNSIVISDAQLDSLKAYTSSLAAK